MMNNKLFMRGMLCVLALALSALSVGAQTDRGTVTGRVTDNTGAAVSGATIVVTIIAVLSLA